ncbi:MAG: iron-containing alcohol dehydrogenase [Pseudomonadota bacterium]
MSLITFLTRVHFADRVLEDALPEAMRRLRVRRPMLITDGDASDLPVVGRLRDALPEGSSLITFPTLPGRALEGRLSAANSTFKLGDADSLICLGGKTAMDFARVLAAMVSSSDGLKKPRPLISIPTSIANVGLGPVHFPNSDLVADGPGHRASNRVALPSAILCDATLTMDTEKSALAAHGFRALTHCIEAFLATAFNPPADGIALEGIRRSALYLERAVHNNRDLDAHRELLAVALNAGLAAQKGFGGAEALVCATEDEGVAEGSAGAVYPAIIRPVLAFNEPAVGGRYDRIGEAMHLPAKMPVAEGVSTIARKVGLPERLKPLRLQPHQIDRVARRAAANPANRTNPRHATHSDYRMFLEAAM